MKNNLPRLNFGGNFELKMLAGSLTDYVYNYIPGLDSIADSWPRCITST